MRITRIAAVAVAALMATGCGTGQGVATATLPPPPLPLPSVATPTPTTARAAPSTSASPRLAPAMPVGDLEPGATYALDLEGGQGLLLTVPAPGWFSIDTWFLGKNETGAAVFSMTLLPYRVGNVYPDPCNWMRGPRKPSVGPTVDDLAAALVEQAGPAGIAPMNVTVGGYAGKKVELSIPDDLDYTTCDEGDFGRWQPVADPEHYGPFTYGNGQHDTVYIIDVDGTRLVIDTNYLPGTPAASVAELEQLVASIRVVP
jgi:hypothetical protein